jgi:hypothetical protein
MGNLESIPPKAGSPPLHSELVESIFDRENVIDLHGSSQTPSPVTLYGNGQGIRYEQGSKRLRTEVVYYSSESL